jgi:hypothetical protein
MALRADTRGPRDGLVDARVKQAVTELAVVRHIDLGGSDSYDLFFGARHWENEQRVKLVPNVANLNQTTLRIEPDWFATVESGAAYSPGGSAG